MAWQKAKVSRGGAVVQHLVVGGDLLALCGVMSLEYSVANASQSPDPAVERCTECCWIALEAAQMASVPAGGESRG
ncbi:MAG: hypothetical protein CVT62_10560 [Actinobacteria bacterium HGW-Actinobacteria-2]|nr:MAG: hypothetical protein CVT62_10560 [Actinobacteria bacterium HGW-Actinobacteria-2]